MQYKQLGKTDIRISAIIFGGWQAGKTFWVGIDDTDSIAAHRAAFENGVTTFDTAEEYGAGHSERILAKALGDHRKDIVIATKVSWKNLRREKVIEACERSLRNLGTDYLDLYQIHWPAGTFGSERVPIEETMGALNTLKEQGKIRAIGVSNFNRAQLEAALQHGRVDSIQPPYSLFFRHLEHDALPVCREQDVTVIAYSPLAQGLLTGRFRRGHVFPRGDNRRDNKLFQGEAFERALEAIEALEPYARKYGVTLGQLALGWLIGHPLVTAAAGARNAAQAVENAAAGDLRIDPAELEAMGVIGERVYASLGETSLMWNW